MKPLGVAILSLLFVSSLGIMPGKASQAEEDEHLLESLGAIAMAFRCPSINIDFALSDQLWNGLKRRGVKYDEGRLDEIFMSKALESERSIKAGNLNQYCLESERDYGPAGRLYPGLVIDRR